MEIQEFYHQIQGDYRDVMNRLIKEERVYKFLCLFLEDPSYDQYCEAIEKKDEESAFRAIHTLKGICLNLGFSSLFEIVNEITEDVRNHSMEMAILKSKSLDEMYQNHIRWIQLLKRER